MSRSNQIGENLLKAPQLGDKFTFVTKRIEIPLKASFSLIETYQEEVNKTQWADRNKKHYLINEGVKDEEGNDKSFVSSANPEKIQKAEYDTPLRNEDDALKLLLKGKKEELKNLEETETKIKNLIEFAKADLKDKEDNGLQYDEKGKIINIIVVPEI